MTYKQIEVAREAVKVKAEDVKTKLKKKKFKVVETEES